MLPFADTRAMQIHLDEISRLVAARAHAVVLMDRAGWHGTDKLDVPKNLTIILLPPRSPELNPVENVWQYLRQNWLSNRVFETYDAILDAGCDAWNKLVAQPQTHHLDRHERVGSYRSLISAVGITPDFAWRLAKGLEAPDGLIVRGKEVVRQALAERGRYPAHSLLGNRGHDRRRLDHRRLRATGERATGAPIVA